MVEQRYWIVGGDYTCMGFKSLRQDGPIALGPYPNRDEAVEVWKQVSREHSSRATVRFAIASEDLRSPN